MNAKITLTKEQSAQWSEKLEALENSVREMKLEASRQLNEGLGSHPIVDGLCAIESMAWALGEMVEKFPTQP